MIFPLRITAHGYSICFENNQLDYFVDSLFLVSVSLLDENVILICVGNRTEERIYIEWENVRINGSQIAFANDYIQDINNPHADEMIMSKETGSKRVLSRRLIPLFDKEKVDDGYSDNIIILLPIRVGKDDYHDMKLNCIVTKRE